MRAELIGTKRKLKYPIKNREKIKKNVLKKMQISRVRKIQDKRKLTRYPIVKNVEEKKMYIERIREDKKRMTQGRRNGLKNKGDKKKIYK